MEPKTARRAQGNQASPNPLHNVQAGLSANTIVLTMNGERAVRDLKPGDRIITRDAGMAILKDIRSSTKTCPTVRIKAGSLGHNRPPDDIMLPAGTQILVRDWRAKALFGQTQALVPAHKLHDGEYVTVLGAATLSVYELTFERPHIIYAGGLEVSCQTSQVVAE